MTCVKKLNDEEIKILKRLVYVSPNKRVRQRAFAIMLSYRKYPVYDISTIFGVHRETARHWVKAWKRYGLQGLYDSPRPGRPRMVKTQMQQQAAG